MATNNNSYIPEITYKALTDLRSSGGLFDDKFLSCTQEVAELLAVGEDAFVIVSVNASFGNIWRQPDGGVVEMVRVCDNADLAIRTCQRWNSDELYICAYTFDKYGSPWTYASEYEVWHVVKDAPKAPKACCFSVTFWEWDESAPEDSDGLVEHENTFSDYKTAHLFACGVSTMGLFNDIKCFAVFPKSRMCLGRYSLSRDGHARHLLDFQEIKRVTGLTFRDLRS